MHRVYATMRSLRMIEPVSAGEGQLITTIRLLCQGFISPMHSNELIERKWVPVIHVYFSLYILVALRYREKVMASSWRLPRSTYVCRQ